MTSERRLSRSGVKETTLDYTRDFAERRGIAEQMGVRSEIEIPAEHAGLRPDRESTAERHPGERERIEDRAPDPRKSRPRSRAGSSCRSARGSRRRSATAPQSVRGPETRARRGGRGPQQDRAGEDGLQIDQKRPQQAEKQRRGMFAGLKLNARSAPSQERTERPEREGACEAPAPDRLAERARGSRRLSRPLTAMRGPISRSTSTGARACRSSTCSGRKWAAGQQLDQVQAGMKDLMRSTLENDPATARAMTELSGRERVAHVIDGMKRENAALQDPNVRAERFVNRWQELQGQRRELRGWQHDDTRAKVENQMSGLAKSLERDPQAESLVRNRSRELGIGQELRRGQSIARELQEEMTRSRQISRGIGLGM